MTDSDENFFIFDGINRQVNEEPTTIIDGNNKFIRNNGTILLNRVHQFNYTSIITGSLEGIMAHTQNEEYNMMIVFTDAQDDFFYRYKFNFNLISGDIGDNVEEITVSVLGNNANNNLGILKQSKISLVGEQDDEYIDSVHFNMEGIIKGSRMRTVEGRKVLDVKFQCSSNEISFVGINVIFEEYIPKNKSTINNPPSSIAISSNYVQLGPLMFMFYPELNIDFD